MSTHFSHKPVLLNEVLETFDYLKDRKDPVFVDGTVGMAGHSLAIAKQVTSRLRSRQANIKIIGIDKDEAALKSAKLKARSLKSPKGAPSGLEAIFTFIHDDFRNYDKIIRSINIKYVDGVLLDLGVSSMQLDDKSRGFSFQDKDMPLDMRMDLRQTKTAASILSSYSITDLEEMLKRGEEKRAKIIAKNVAQFRKNKKINRVSDLLEILEKSIPLKIQKTSKTHYSTATFRALRIEVNDELNNLEQTIINVISSLKPNSRLAIITFHSLEDRIVKQTFKKLANPCTCPPKLPYCVCGKKAEIKIMTKKPILPSEKEISDNPRSRSAKLRIIEKI